MVCTKYDHNDTCRTLETFDSLGVQAHKLDTSTIY